MSIYPPFIKCPKCGQETFGVLLIFDDHYSRRCKECLYPHPKRSEPSASYPLPKLNKKVIYLDQCAISNMMKILNPNTKAYQRGKVDKFWLELFERLDSLCKLQLVVCPDSMFHIDESLLSSFYEPLKQMYKLLSHSITFDNPVDIKRHQIYEHASNWISNHPDKELNLDVHSVVFDKINAWQDRFIISGNIQYPSEWIDDIRNTREKICNGFARVFKRWQSEKNKSFYDWFEEVANSFGRLVLGEYISYIKRIAERPEERPVFAIDRAMLPWRVKIVESICIAFQKAGVQDADIPDRTTQYLTSPYIKDIPFNKISSMLIAALARKAAAGQKTSPDVGMDYDIKIISTLLPYCDAMFIDNKCHAYLKEKPLCDEIGYGTAVFSQYSKEEFLEYLNEVEKNASKEHLDKVYEVYGRDWQKPYKTLYQ